MDMKNFEKDRQAYRALYDRIQPSEELQSRLYHISNKRRKKGVLRYAVAAIACIVCIGSVSIYANKNPRLFQEFFRGGAEDTKLNQLYQTLDQQITCGNYIFTFEGYIYTPEIHVGFLAVRVNRRDGSVPEIQYADPACYVLDDRGKSVNIEPVTHNYKIDKELFSVFLDREDVHLEYTHIPEAKEEDGAYIYYKLRDEVDGTLDAFQLHVAKKEDIKALFNKKSMKNMEETLYRSFPSVTIDTSHTDNEVRVYHQGENTMKLSSIGLELIQKNSSVPVEQLALIEENGKRIEIIKDGEICMSKEDSCPFSGSTSEDGTSELYYSLSSAIDLDTIRVEMNHQMMKNFDGD